MTIAAIRTVIDSARWEVMDLQGHTSDEFRRRNVPEVMARHFAALDSLDIAPRFVKDIENREYMREALQRQIERWVRAQPVTGRVQ
jgi:hypothetical protein